jgi:hypothetical protein
MSGILLPTIRPDLFPPPAPEELTDAELFGPPEFRPDFAAIGRKTSLTRHEAVAALVGVSPDQTESWWFDADHQYPFSSHVIDAYRAIESRIAMDQRTGDLAEPIPPVALMAWVLRHAVHIPPELAEAVADNERCINALERQLARAEARYRDLENRSGASHDAVLPRERASLLTLVVGMAISGWKWDPHKPRTTVVAEIVSDLALAGLKVSPETVLKYLREGYVRSKDEIDAALDD